MATFNGARFVEQQIRSVISQDRPPDELLVADDRSDDGTTALLQQLLADAPFPWRLGVNAARLGPVRNFATLFEQANGDLIVPCDQDDWWAPSKLRHIVTHMAAHDCDVAVHDAHIVGDDGRRLRGTLWSRVPFPPAERRSVADGGGLAVLLRHNVVTGAAMAFRRPLLERLDPFPGAGMHDYTLALAASVAGGICVLDEPLGAYRVHTANTAGLPSRRNLTALRHRNGDVARLAAEHLVQVVDRLDGAGLLAWDQRAAMQARIDFLRRRASLPERTMDRALVVRREWVQHDGYRRFARGLRSAALDVIVGPGR